MKRILFVDDEVSILDALKRMLRPQREIWDTAFASGGEAALAMLEATPFDVIVSDMRMPGMDGATLLGTVCEKYPNALRIILSGYTELEATFRAAPVAHQFLLKPCDADALRTAIERGTNLVDLLNSKMLISIVGSLRDLPSAPGVFTELRTALAAPDPSLDRIAKIVERDVGIATKVLQLVNSAFFGVARDVTNIKTAVTYLGTSLLQNLVLSVAVFRTFKPKKPIPDFSIERFEEHSHLTAGVVTRMAPKTGAAKLASATVVAGLLHDVGKLVLAERAPEHFARAIAGAKSGQRPLYQVEEQLIGVSHAEIGAYLLALWGIPFPVVEAVAHHHHPDRVPREKWDMSTVVYLANMLAHEQAALGGQDDGLADGEIDANVIAPLGGEASLGEWRKIAEEAASAPQRGVK